MYLCFDLGGTDIKAGIIDEQGSILDRHIVSTNVAGGVQCILQQFKEVGRDLLRKIAVQEQDLKGIGVGIPGFVVMEEGLVINAPNLGWQNILIKEQLAKIFLCPVFVTNDANAAALGEMWRGAGQQKKNLLCLTLGTGIGAGIVIDGKIHNGSKGLAGEIGHFQVNPYQGRLCNCGKVGCLETESSGRALALEGERIVKEGYDTILVKVMQEKGLLSSRDIVTAAAGGDKGALQIVDKGACFLGQALANIYMVTAPEQIIIGGGLAQGGDILFEPLIKWFNHFSFPDLKGETLIIPAKLGNDAGIIGLAKLAKTAKHQPF